jgi:hypothetical protein
MHIVGREEKYGCPLVMAVSSRLLPVAAQFVNSISFPSISSVRIADRELNFELRRHRDRSPVAGSGLAWHEERSVGLLMYWHVMGNK